MAMLPVAATAMFSTFAMGFPMVLAMMVAKGIRIPLKFSSQKICYRLIRLAGNPAIQTNPRFCQRVFCACANAAANQRIYANLF